MWRGGHWGPRHFRERVFEKGDLKYVILELLVDKPKHGYEVIRDLEERFGGLYSPSPGAVYPTLQMLEDLGYVTSNQQDGKRVYQIAEEGRAFLAERKDTVDDIRSRMQSHWGPWFDEEGAKEFAEEVREFAHGMKDFAKLFAKSQGAVWRDPARRERLRDILKRTRQEIDELLKEK